MVAISLVSRLSQSLRSMLLIAINYVAMVTLILTMYNVDSLELFGFDINYITIPTWEIIFGHSLYG